MLSIRYTSILKVALPMMLSGFIQSVISITDASFLSRYSPLAYDAAGSAGLWYITMHMVLIGLSDGAQINMAQKIGAKDKQGFVNTFQSSLFILFCAAILLTALVAWVLPPAMNAFISSAELAHAEERFLLIRSYSFWAGMITLTIQATYLAVGKTSLVMTTSLIVAISNILLDYLWIFGKGPFPEMGLEGAAWASTTAEYIGMFFLILTLFFGNLKKDYTFFQTLKLHRKELLETLKIGTPLLLQGLVALSIWTVFFTWIEQMGGNNLTVSLNIRYIYFLAFIPIWGFAAATKTYIAQYHGAKEFSLIPIIQRRIQVMTVLFLLLTFHGSVLYPEQLIQLVSEDSSSIQQSAQILRMVSLSILIYGLGSVYFQTLSGIGKSKITFAVELISTGLYLICAYCFIKLWHWPIEYVWLVEYVYFIATGLLSFGYLKLVYKNT